MMLLHIIREHLFPKLLTLLIVTMNSAEGIELISEDALGRGQELRAILHLVESCHLEGIPHLPNVHQSRVTAA